MHVHHIWSLVKATLLSETSVNEVDLVYYSVSKRQTECLGRRTTGFIELHKETKGWRVEGWRTG